MFEIRFYFKNDDKHLKKEITVHIYNSFKTYEAAYEEFINLFDYFEKIGIQEICFCPSMPKKILEHFILFLHDEKKVPLTIVNVDN